MGITAEERELTFKDELYLIYDEVIREFTRLCLLSAPEYFFTDCPASTSGKYHPLNELGPDGTILHTKKVCRVAVHLCRGLGCESSRDEIISACIIHDLRKQGLYRSGHTVKIHPDLGAKLVTEVQEATQLLSDKSFTIIRDSVGYHYGPWSINPWIKPLNEYTMEELTVYMSDYVASKRDIEVLI